MVQYTSRDVGDPSQIKKNKQSMADLKLRRLTELNNRLREDLERERIPVSTASKRFVPLPCRDMRPIQPLTRNSLASSPIATAPEITWSPQSGAPYPRVKIPMRHSSPAAAALSCNHTILIRSELVN